MSHQWSGDDDAGARDERERPYTQAEWEGYPQAQKNAGAEAGAEERIAPAEAEA